MSDQANKNVLLEMKSSETLTASTCPNMKDPTVTATALGPRDSDTGDTYSTRHDVFIQEIEGMDDYWGSTFRAVYDQSDQVAFQRQLELRIRQHDRNIERMCNFHYQGFIDSIRQLLQVRADAGRLKTQVITGNEALQQQSQQLLAMAEQLERARRVRAHVAEGLAALRRCLPVLQAYSKLRKQMREQRFYPALRTLEQLEQLHLPRVAPYRFSQQMLESVPRMRQHIRAASMSDLKDFLEVVRRESARVGEAAMRRLVEPAAGGRPTPVVEKRLTLAFLGVDALQAISVYGQGEHVEEDADVSPQDLVDFSTVYRCLHVFSALGDGESFRSYYLMQRQKQAALALRPPASSGSGQPPALVGVRDCLHGVAGFFVIEDHVFNTARGLVTRSQLDNLWAETFSELTEVLQTNAVTCTDANLLLTLARLISLFGRTMRDYGYPVSALHQLLLGLRQHYTEVLMQRWVTVFREIFLLDNYHPVQVDTAAEYAQIAAVFPYQNAQLERAPFPRQFPFSLMVPKVYSQVKEFIHSCLRFSEELELSQSEKDDALRRSTNVLLTRTLSGCWQH